MANNNKFNNNMEFENVEELGQGAELDLRQLLFLQLNRINNMLGTYPELVGGHLAALDVLLSLCTCSNKCRA